MKNVSPTIDMAARGGGGKAHVVDDGGDYDGPAAPPNGYVLP